MHTSVCAYTHTHVHTYSALRCSELHGESATTSSPSLVVPGKTFAQASSAFPAGTVASALGQVKQETRSVPITILATPPIWLHSNFSAPAERVWVGTGAQQEA